MAATKRGKTLSDEHKQRVSASLRERWAAVKASGIPWKWKSKKYFCFSHRAPSGAFFIARRYPEWIVRIQS